MQQVQSLLGAPVRREGSLISQEFDEMGNPIDVRQTIQDPTTRIEGGLLGGQLDPQSMAFAKSQLQDVYSPQRVESIMSPYQRAHDMQQQAAYKQQAAAMDQQDKFTPKFMEEERGAARTAVGSFNKRVGQMRTDYSKLEGLANEARAGSRPARASMLINIARLNSPGVVSDKEAAQLTGGANPVAAVIAKLQDSGVDMAALLGKHFDPYGEGFDADELLRIGRSLVTSSSSPLLTQYEAARSRAQRAGISDLAFQTNFGNNPSYEYLKGFNKAPTPQSTGKMDFDTWRKSKGY